MFLLWGLLSSSIVWTFYFGLLPYPLALLWNERRMRGATGHGPGLSGVAWWFWIAAVSSLVTEVLWVPFLRGIGIHMWAALFVWAAMAVSAFRVRPVAVATTAPS